MITSIYQQKKEEYILFLKEQIQQKEEQQIKCNSLYEFRVIQCFDTDYKQEIEALCIYIKQNKMCKTDGNHQFRNSDNIIVPKLDKQGILNSSAIMIDNSGIQYVQSICLYQNLSFLVMDNKLLNMYTFQSKTELLSRLNSVDIVIMDSKDHMKITQFLNNEVSIQNIDDERIALTKLFDILGNKSYQNNDISSELTEIANNLQFLIQKNKYQENIQLSSFPQCFDIKGPSFQRFILVPGIKKLKYPIYSKCSWILSSLKDKQLFDFNITNSFIKKLQQYQSTLPLYDLDKIMIYAYLFQFKQVLKTSQITLNSQLYQKKITLDFVKYQQKQIVHHILHQNSFLPLPFNIIYQEPKKDINQSQIGINPLANVDFNLVQVLAKIKFISQQVGIDINSNITEIIQKNIQEACSICFNNTYQTKFVFVCCGSVISSNCLINIIKTTGTIKCSNCRFIITDNCTQMGFFVTVDPQVKIQSDMYQSFSQCYMANKSDNTDIITISGNNINYFNNSLELFQQCQIFVCIDNIYPDISFNYQEDIYSKNYILYHIQKTLYQHLYNTNYKKIDVFLYSSQSTVYNHIKQFLTDIQYRYEE